MRRGLCGIKRYSYFRPRGEQQDAEEKQTGERRFHRTGGEDCARVRKTERYTIAGGLSLGITRRSQSMETNRTIGFRPSVQSE